MGYTPPRTVYRLAHKQLHLHKANLWRSRFPYLYQYESCLAYQPFVSCRFYLLRATGQNIRYSGVNCPLGPSKSIRYSGDFVTAGFCFHIFYCNSAGLSNVARCNGVFAIAGFLCTARILLQSSQWFAWFSIVDWKTCVWVCFWSSYNVSITFG